MFVLTSLPTIYLYRNVNWTHVWIVAGKGVSEALLYVLDVFLNEDLGDLV